MTAPPTARPVRDCERISAITRTSHSDARWALQVMEITYLVREGEPVEVALERVVLLEQERC
jgi:hypothetical protein